MLKQYIDKYLSETKEIADMLCRDRLEEAIKILLEAKGNRGRLFILGVGGSAANASHAVNDFRKICRIEAYTPVDNVAELTAWTNDSGFESTFINWLKTSRLDKKDTVLILSVGGGTETTSKNLVLAMEHTKDAGARIISIVSRDGGRALGLSDVCILIPVVSADRITAHAEGYQALLLHLMVNALKEGKR